jgi:hypothetical protein
MKRIIFYVILPGLVLGVVYQMGRDAGARSSPESSRIIQSQSPEEIDRKLALVSEKLAQIESLRSGKAPAPSVQVAKPDVPPAVLPAVSHSPEVYRVREIPKVIETERIPSAVPMDRPKLNPSELGLLPLQPLGDGSVLPIRSDSLPAYQVPPLPVESFSECDCGKNRK